ncbi:hypothetical protein COCC4DRAFT_60016 [Bipolaris maydis ATCC 48331]|uniref:F-box domain-containing protein n=2 Tax=Cochliobolus heterostrophus TaxID=5016 RepID=M2UTH3_COCH5|nr:uncharacterized protein COCC4DRAFT_60016 [Bipolaris maydis ATCC 48331]EMD91172.1 hypothetical protein COCHEDRAFT_1225163 [Bipolaris maydis C5]KAJ5022870.1 hypothetical protein J3E73DRAFT_401445 [Bipolaris maydis]ENI05747.1 hypothetical protein COCC4DRAFT_60016 [Bipolaris maydis ATCC 48331]KAJ6205049.1 hypothetical protein PSV09DRAFT_1225163 [Bipolaris maydis]KAJ6268117.1 hypothetical protein PSV08DRAFT_379621 [Bipolaris maydis]
MKVKKWLQSQRNEERTSLQNPRTARVTFLDLPGEIRNQIYAYSIYADLSSLFVANCTKPEHFGATVLHPPLFRTCRQIRAEAFSYLCATCQLGFLGIRSAVLFFSLVGEAVSEIKSLAVTRPVVYDREYKERKDIVEQFFSTLDTMSGLSKIRFEGLADWIKPDKKGAKLDFHMRLEKLRERHVVVQIK